MADYDLLDSSMEGSMAELPRKTPGTRLSLCLTDQGLTVYGNKQAFADLVENMSWIGHSDPKDHFECHVRMSLGDDESIFDKKRPRNISLLMNKEIYKLFQPETKNNYGFELTFMLVENHDLDEMAKYDDQGILPDDWGTSE